MIFQATIQTIQPSNHAPRMGHTPSLVLVETLTMFCSVREVMERKETQAPQQSKPTVARPGFNMCENLPNFSTAKYLIDGEKSRFIYPPHKPEKLPETYHIGKGSVSNHHFFGETSGVWRKPKCKVVNVIISACLPVRLIS